MAVDNTTKRAARAGSFAFELGGKIVGYLKKCGLPKLQSDVHTNDGGPVSVQSKQVVKMSWGPCSIDIGLGMSSEMYDWINATFKHNYQMKDCAVLMMNENYDIVRRCDMTHCHLTEITIPALEGKAKEAMYLSCKIQPEMTRYTNGGGKATAALGPSQKLFAATNFHAQVPGLPCDNVSKVDALKFEVKVTEDAVGRFIESRYVCSKATYPDLKFTVNEVDSEPWYNKFFSYIQAGKRTVSDELAIGIDILGPDASKPIATLEFTGCGPKEFSHPDRTANEDKVAAIEASFFVEGIELKYHEKN